MRNTRQLVDKVENILASTYRQRKYTYSPENSWSRNVMKNIHHLEYNLNMENARVEKLVWKIGWGMAVFAIVILTFSTVSLASKSSQKKDNFWNEMEEYTDVTHYLIEHDNGA